MPECPDKGHASADGLKLCKIFAMLKYQELPSGDLRVLQWRQPGAPALWVVVVLGGDLGVGAFLRQPCF